MLTSIYEKDLACEPAPFTPATVSTPAATQAAVDVCEAESISSPEPMTCQSHSSSQPDYFALRRSASVVEIANGVRKEEEEEKRGKTEKQSPFQQQPRTPKDDDAASTSPPYEVHGGMLLLARAMGCKCKPVHDAVLAALLKNPHYGKKNMVHSYIGAHIDYVLSELILCGHSLGAGVATLLALVSFFAFSARCRSWEPKLRF